MVTLGLHLPPQPESLGSFFRRAPPGLPSGSALAGKGEHVSMPATVLGPHASIQQARAVVDPSVTASPNTTRLLTQSIAALLSLMSMLAPLNLQPLNWCPLLPLGPAVSKRLVASAHQEVIAILTPDGGGDVPSTRLASQVSDQPGPILSLEKGTTGHKNSP